MKKLLITIPCHNEEVVLESTVEAVRAYAAEYLGDYAWEVLIIDNASTDGTYEIAKRFNVIRYPEKGRGAALKHVWLEKSGYDIYAYMDADLATDLKDFKALVDSVAAGYDLAVGSRYLSEARVRRTAFRKFASKIYNQMARWLLPVRFSDAQCGFKAMRASFVREIFPETHDTGWFWDTELIVLAGMKKKRVRELPVTWKEVRTRQRKSTVAPFREMFIQVRNLIRFRRSLRLGAPTGATTALVLVGFAVLLALGLTQVYHQDEYRWVEMVLRIHDNPIDQPPLTPFLYGIVIKLFGVDWMRILPAVFGLLNIVLVAKLGSRLAAVLFAISSYTLIASLQIDIDGAVLPFFVLATVYGYQRVWQGDRRGWWLLALALIGGFLTKLSFVLCVGALMLDVATRIPWRTLLKWSMSAAIVGACGIVALGAFNPQIMSHALDISLFDFSSRLYLDLGYKVLKSLVLLSPLLFIPTLAGLFVKGIRTTHRVWYLYLGLNLLFYLVLFNFSTLTIERYFMFLIAPCAIIAGAFFEHYRVSRKAIVPAAMIAAAVTAIALALPHTIIPQYPKVVFLDAVRSLRFDFLIPITGGSGPAGLYVSAYFVVWIWLLSFVALALWRWLPRGRSFSLALVISLGLMSNIVITQEYLAGGLYGSVSNLVKTTVGYVNANDDITEVGTYYDIGLRQLHDSGKYANRFYLSPRRDYSAGIESFRGHYMVVDFPKVDDHHPYILAIRRCPELATFTEKEIRAYVYDCTQLPLMDNDEIPVKVN